MADGPPFRVVDLLNASLFELTLATRHLLMEKHDGYVKEKLALAEERINMAQEEGPANN